jgi:hypothetical protein
MVKHSIVQVLDLSKTMLLLQGMIHCVVNTIEYWAANLRTECSHRSIIVWSCVMLMLRFYDF